jgi:MFS family permease
MRERSRWHSFSAALLAASVAGTSYAFGIFSEVFKQRLGYSQADLSIVSSCGSTGLYTQVVTGFLIEKYGPQFVLKLGAFLIFSNNLYIWGAVLGHVPASVPIISLAWFLAQIGIACASSVCLVVALKSFPTSVRGRVAGLAKAYFGISSAVLASIAAGFFGLQSADFILFVAIALPLTLLYCSTRVRFLPPSRVPFAFERSR